MKTILGIDPGSNHTGFGVVRCDGDRIVHVGHGVISAKASWEFEEKLLYIGSEIDKIFTEFEPEITVVERIFLGKNADSAFKLGHARGVCLYSAAKAGSKIVEYAAKAVKKGITGSGSAEKEQVQMIIFATLGIRTQAQVDASDALALAFYHARNLEVQSVVNRAIFR